MLLLGYDSVVSITQDALNFQLQTLWKLGIIPSSYSTSRGSTTLTVTQMGAPTVDLAPPGGSHIQVLLSLPCQQGSFTYWDMSGGTPVQATATLNNNTIAYLVNMGIEEVDQQQIAALNKSYGGKIDIAGPLKDFPDDLFTINHLFLDFESLTISSWNQSASVMTGLSTDAQTALATFLIDYQQDNPNGYILGYAVTTDNPTATSQVTPVFAPTFSQYLTSPYNSSYDPSPTSGGAGLDTLNFTLMLGPLGPTHQPPANPADQFTVNWVNSADAQSGCSGVFVIGASVFTTEYVQGVILTTLTNALTQSGIITGETFQRGTGGWTVTHTSVNTSVAGTDWPLNIYCKHSVNNTLTVNDFANGPNGTIVMSGSGSLYQEGYYYEKPADIDVWDGTAWAKLDYSLTITLSAGVDGTITVTPKLDGGSGPQTGKSDNWVQKVFDIIGLGIGAYLSGVNTDFSQLEGFQWSAFRTETGEGFAALAKMTVFPALAFFYKDLGLNSEGDLLLRVTYKS